MYDLAYRWSHGEDIRFVSNHRLKNPVFTNERVEDFIIYNDLSFSCEVHLEKNMVVSGKTKVDILPEGVFSQLKILKIILLEADEEIIINHLSKRDNKFYSKEQIVELQSTERTQALKIASELEIPIVIHQMKFDDCDIDEILIKIKEDFL